MLHLVKDIHWNCEKIHFRARNKYKRASYSIILSTIEYLYPKVKRKFG